MIDDPSNIGLDNALPRPAQHPRTEITPPEWRKDRRYGVHGSHVALAFRCPG